MSTSIQYYIGQILEDNTDITSPQDLCEYLVTQVASNSNNNFLNQTGYNSLEKAHHSSPIFLLRSIMTTILKLLHSNNVEYTRLISAVKSYIEDIEKFQDGEANTLSSPFLLISTLGAVISGFNGKLHKMLFLPKEEKSSFLDEILNDNEQMRERHIQDVKTQDVRIDPTNIFPFPNIKNTNPNIGR